MSPTTRRRRVFHRYWWAPKARSVLNGTFFRRDSLDTSHLLVFRDGWESIGPVQRDEAVLLYGLLRALRPRTVVEFGFSEGRSALNVLRALDPDARLYSYDVGEHSARLATELFGHDERLRFFLKSQADFEPADVDGRPVDFVFLDASHDLALNQQTLRRVLPCLTPDAVIAIHDTGTVSRALMDPQYEREADEVWSDRWVTPESFEHQPGERATLNWLRDEHPEFAQINVHTERVVRWGLTLLQRSERLSTVHP